MDTEQEDALIRKQYLEEFLLRIKDAKMQKSTSRPPIDKTCVPVQQEQRRPGPSLPCQEVNCSSEDEHEVKGPSAGGTTDVSGVESDYVKRHLASYYKLLDVQPRRHTEEQKRREKPQQPGVTPFQQELFKLRDKYKREFIEMKKEKAAAASRSAGAILDRSSSIGTTEKSECVTPEEEYFSAEEGKSSSSDSEEVYEDLVEASASVGNLLEFQSSKSTQQEPASHNDEQQCCPDSTISSEEEGAEELQADGEHENISGAPEAESKDGESTQETIVSEPQRLENAAPVFSVPVSKSSAFPILPTMMTGQPPYNPFVMCAPMVLPHGPQPQTGPEPPARTARTSSSTGSLPSSAHSTYPPAVYPYMYLPHLVPPGPSPGEDAGSEKQAQGATSHPYPLFMPFMLNPSLTPEGMSAHGQNVPFPPYLYLPQPEPPIDNSGPSTEVQKTNGKPASNYTALQQGLVSVIPGINPLGHVESKVAEPVTNRVSSYARKYTSIWDISDSESGDGQSTNGDSQNVILNKALVSDTNIGLATEPEEHLEEDARRTTSPVQVPLINPVPKPQRVLAERGSLYHGSCAHRHEEDSPSMRPRPKGRGRGHGKCPQGNQVDDNNRSLGDGFPIPNNNPDVTGLLDSTRMSEEAQTCGSQDNSDTGTLIAGMGQPVRPRYGPRSITHPSSKEVGDSRYGPRAARRKHQEVSVSVADVLSPLSVTKTSIQSEKSECVNFPPGFNFRRASPQEEAKVSVRKTQPEAAILRSPRPKGPDTQVKAPTDYYTTKPDHAETQPAETKKQLTQTKTQTTQTTVQSDQNSDKSAQSHTPNANNLTTHNKPLSPRWNSSTLVTSHQSTQFKDDHLSPRYREPPFQAKSHSDYYPSKTGSERRAYRDGRGRRGQPKPPRFQRQNPSGHTRPQNPPGHTSPQNPSEHTRAQSPSGHTRPQNRSGHTRPQNPSGHTRPQNPSGHTRPQSPSGHTRPQNPSGHTRPQSPSGHTRPQNPSGHTKPSNHSGPHGRQQPMPVKLKSKSPPDSSQVQVDKAKSSGRSGDIPPGEDSKVSKETNVPAVGNQKDLSHGSDVQNSISTDKTSAAPKSKCRDTRLALLGVEKVNGSRENELDDRIRQIRMKNCKILERQKEVEEDIKASQSRV